MIMIIYFEVIQHSDQNSLLANNHGNQKHTELYRNDFG